MKTKRLKIIIGRGTKKERIIETDIELFYSHTLKKWVTIPND